MARGVMIDKVNHPHHRHRSSAYVQHLAEACAIVSNDARWRTSDDNTGTAGLLFSVEHGDDVSAMRALASLYDGTMMANNTSPDPPNQSIDNIDESVPSVDDSNHHEDENNKVIVLERAMHLYSRMFVRKGPWFDMADLYARYYFNNESPQTNNSEQMQMLENTEERELGGKSSSVLDESFNGTTSESGDCVVHNERDNLNKKCEGNVHQFFKPRRSLSSSSSSGIKNNLSHHNDEDNLFSHHRIGLESLFRDVYHLCSMGLLRSFNSEYECGLVSGHVDKMSGRGILLSAEERRDVLVRCGGGAKGKQQSRRSMGASSSTSAAVAASSSTTTSAMARKIYNNNEILTHMQSQQSLLASFFVTTPQSGGGNDGAKRRKRASYPSSNTTKLLPVSKHVDAVLVRKLAVRVAMLTSGQMTPPRKSEVEQALRIVQLAQSAALKQSNGNDNDDDDDDDDAVICLGNEGSIGSAFRLREAPLKTLRRCMRLFLCAGAGPGAMRGDGTNGWMSVLEDEVANSEDDSCRKYPSSVLPCSRWHNVVYPGLSSRFGLEFYELSRCYTPIQVDDGCSVNALNTTALGAFSYYHEFQLWEIGAELRSFIDRVNEAYETEKQQTRRRSREKREAQAPLIDEVDKENAIIHLLTFDGFTLLTENGRRDFVEGLLAPCFNEAAHSSHHIALNKAMYDLCPRIEADILSLSNITIDDVSEDVFTDGFLSDTERLIVAFAVICWRILELRIEHPSSMLTSLVDRPWLRHMSFDSILAYILWDSVPIFERRGHHSMAVSILQTILFGRDVLSIFDGNQLLFECLKSEPFVECLLPRRNRGKACERLLIDLSHMERRAKKIAQAEAKLDKTAKKTVTDESKQSPAHSFCKAILKTIDSIPFCSLRNLARRSKSPIPQNKERSILFIRQNNDDWSPTTDCAVANSLTIPRDGGDSAAGKRCAFVGWEIHDDDGETMEAYRSLNVEELAMDEYHSGRLPHDAEEMKGQWVGWHDEGGHVRALFRILCLQHQLIDLRPGEVTKQKDHTTVILTPYQNSPHDLHVGHFQTATGLQVRGFYERRRDAIEEFLSNLNNLDADGISKMVFQAIRERWDSHIDDRSRLRDPRLIKDVTELRTLSMIASALGPVSLSRIFRTLCFDYRHWSGGLPDLFLVRAYDCDSPATSINNSSSPFIQLADWIGEGFSQRRVDEKYLLFHTSMLSDRDDEFLGQPKSADAFPSQQQYSRRKNNTTACIQLPEYPEMLEFVHEKRRVRADCLFVEVKSANDRLSERQEDWLSILESSTNARVCKFTNSQKGIQPVGESAAG